MVTDTDFEEIKYEVAAGVATITLDRPNQRNAQTQKMLNELDRAFEAATDAAVRVVILRGAGDHFSAGHDLKEAQRSRADFTVEERWEYEQRHYFQYALRIWEFPKPTIAAVQGACIAGGFVLANMCDLIVAADDAFFSDKVTAVMGAATTEVLIHPWIMNDRRARELLFTGEQIDAHEAYRIGMVNRVCERGLLDETTRALATRIASAPAFGVALTKRSLNQARVAQGFLSSLAAHFGIHQLSHVSAEYERVRQAGLATVIRTK